MYMHNMLSKGWVARVPFLTGNAVRPSKGWACWEANLVMQTGSNRRISPWAPDPSIPRDWAQQIAVEPVTAFLGVDKRCSRGTSAPQASLERPPFPRGFGAQFDSCLARSAGGQAGGHLKGTSKFIFKSLKNDICSDPPFRIPHWGTVIGFSPPPAAQANKLVVSLQCIADVYFNVEIRKLSCISTLKYKYAICCKWLCLS